MKGNDDKPPGNAIGAESVTCSMDTMEGIVNIPMSGAPASLGDDVLSLPITRSTTPTFSTRTNVPTTGTTKVVSYGGTTLENKERLGKGPGNGQDSLRDGWGDRPVSGSRVFTPQSGKKAR